MCYYAISMTLLNYVIVWYDYTLQQVRTDGRTAREMDRYILT